MYQTFGNHRIVIVVIDVGYIGQRSELRSSLHPTKHSFSQNNSPTMGTRKQTAFGKETKSYASKANKKSLNFEKTCRQRTETAAFGICGGRPAAFGGRSNEKYATHRQTERKPDRKKKQNCQRAICGKQYKEDRQINSDKRTVSRFRVQVRNDVCVTAAGACVCMSRCRLCNNIVFVVYAASISRFHAVDLLHKTNHKNQKKVRTAGATQVKEKQRCR